VHHAVFLVRIVLNIAGVSLILAGLTDVVSAENRLVHNIVHSLFATRLAVVGWKVLLASLVVHGIAYFHHKFHLMHELVSGSNPEAARVKPILFKIAHLSIVNFSIDIPGIPVKSVAVNRYIITVLNLISMLMLLVVIDERPMVDCWGCYAPGTSIADLKYGPCPAFSDNPEHALNPVCDEPGVECDTADARWKTMLTATANQVRVLLSVSFAIYVLSMVEKEKYYAYRYDSAAITARLSPKKDI
jgi:hypothetical protein